MNNFIRLIKLYLEFKAKDQIQLKFNAKAQIYLKLRAKDQLFSTLNSILLHLKKVLHL